MCRKATVKTSPKETRLPSSSCLRCPSAAQIRVWMCRPGLLAQPSCPASAQVTFQRQVQSQELASPQTRPLVTRVSDQAWCPELRSLLVTRPRVALEAQIGGHLILQASAGAQSLPLTPECPPQKCPRTSMQPGLATRGFYPGTRIPPALTPTCGFAVMC